MKTKKKKISDSTKKSGEKKKHKHSADFTDPEINTDKTGSDNDADKTVKRKNPGKTKLEVNPDSTGIDTKADKTKKEKFPEKEKNK